MLALSAALCVAAILAFAIPVLRSDSRAVGDGVDPGSYGFDLASATVPREQIVAAGIAKAQIPALVAPPAMPGADVPAFNEQHRGKYLVPGDRVIGVEINGEARAYPLRVLNWHEIVNDTLGGVAIAVTYHPLCDSVVVFDRRVNGQVLEFGVSGLLLQSNLLLYDRHDATQRESLWSQLQARAVAGPAAQAGRRLKVLPASLARWDHWLEHHPDSEVLRPDEVLLHRYRRNPYGNYFRTGRPRFPVMPADDDRWAPMQRLLVLLPPRGLPQVYPSDAVAGPAIARALVAPPVDGPDAAAGTAHPAVDVRPADPPSWVLRPGPGTGTIYVLAFAWSAQHDAEAQER